MSLPLSLPHKIGLAFLASIIIFTAGFIQGRNYGREATLKAAVAAYQTREKIKHETDNLNPSAICLALGGLQYECSDLLRRMDKAAQD